MTSSTLDENTRRNILFDVVDGIPPSGNELEEAIIYRKEIETDNIKLEFRAEELGIHNPLFEYLSQGQG